MHKRFVLTVAFSGKTKSLHLEELGKVFDRDTSEHIKFGFRQAGWFFRKAGSGWQSKRKEPTLLDDDETAEELQVIKHGFSIES